MSAQPRATDAPEELGALLAAHMRDGVAVGHEGRIEWASARFGELLGLGGDAALAGTPLSRWLGAPAAELCDGGECELQAGDGRRLLLRCVAVPAGRLWLLEDASEPERLERDARRLAERLDAAERDLKEERQSLDDERTRHERVLQVISHELRTPVTVIAGYSRLLLAEASEALTEPQRHFLTQTSEGCRRLDRLIGNLLDASAARGVGGQPLIRPDDLSETVEAVATFLGPLVDEHGVELELSLDEAARRASFDRSRIGQVLTNLLSNALRYAGGRVSLATRAEERAGGRWVVVTVEDDGPGIPSDRHARVFEPYVRGVGEDDEGGLGLGLAIARRIVEAHAGCIEVSAGGRGGARFEVAWPAAGGDAAPQPASGSSGDR